MSSDSILAAIREARSVLRGGVRSFVLALLAVDGGLALLLTAATITIASGGSPLRGTVAGVITGCLCLVVGTLVALQFAIAQTARALVLRAALARRAFDELLGRMDVDENAELAVPAFTTALNRAADDAVGDAAEGSGIVDRACRRIHRIIFKMTLRVVLQGVLGHIPSDQPLTLAFVRGRLIDRIDEKVASILTRQVLAVSGAILGAMAFVALALAGMIRLLPI